MFLNEREAEFALRYHKPSGSGSTALEARFPILSRCDIELNGRCRLNLRRTVRPEFVLVGDGHLGQRLDETRGRRNRRGGAP